LCYHPSIPSLEPTVFDEIASAEAEADRRAEADVAAGRIIAHAAMKTWLTSWGTTDEQLRHGARRPD
jgi:predicted transcriptional regulator